MTASTTTTIRGVSIFSRQQKRKTDIFDVALSQAGIVIQRPGRSDQRMGWDRISEWEIEERPGCVVLTLRGGGSVTPLMVQGWTLEDLETIMRDATEGSTGPASEDAARSDADAYADGHTPDMEAAFAPPPDEEPAMRVPVEATVRPSAPTDTSPEPRAARRQAAQPPRRGGWRPLVTIVLLGVLATAVTVVLLQSAGIIDWSFLGPVA